MQFIHDEILCNDAEFTEIQQRLTQQMQNGYQQLIQQMATQHQGLTWATDGTTAPNVGNTPQNNGEEIGGSPQELSMDEILKQWASPSAKGLWGNLGNWPIKSQQEAEDKALRRRIREQTVQLLKEELGIDLDLVREDRNKAIMAAIRIKIEAIAKDDRFTPTFNAEVKRVVEARFNSDLTLSEYVNQVKIEARKKAIEAAEKFIEDNLTVRTQVKAPEPGRKLHL